MTRRIIEGCYARLKGLHDAAVFLKNPNLPLDYATDYAHLLEDLRNAGEDKFQNFDLPENAVYRGECHVSVEFDCVISKYKQLIAYLELVHSASNKIIELGIAYNLIRDVELKSRCADLLSLPAHFDRVINQATQVLEERLRSKFPQFANQIGAGLVNSIIKNDPGESFLKFSNTPAEQEGYAQIMRGMVAAFRNTSHHRFIENVSREQALQICAFVDNLLSAIDSAEPRKDK